MRNYIRKHLTTEKMPVVLEVIIFIIVLILLGVLIGGGFFLIDLLSFKKEMVLSTNTLNQKLNNLEAALATTTLTSQELAQRLKDQQNQTEEFADTIDDIAGTVNTLEKLSKTDQELLQKYSKVYFLSDNYIPLRLKDIDQNYLAINYKNLQFHASALKYLEDMFDDAEDDGMSLQIVSAYRSFGTQSALKTNYLVTYGSGANQFSADQGYSEHQLGTALDITTANQLPVLATTFENTPAFKWLESNAYKYGFVLSYPKGNAYYQYEPWHWRFVGIKLATRLHRDGLNFSDMDQRDIDKYLVNIFD
ncbi:MAG: D-alanyl-D-alanine carboxypeptidase family protein [Candidatus Paceibacterota bacterium]